METVGSENSCGTKGLAIIAIVFSLLFLYVAFSPCICRSTPAVFIVLEPIAVGLGIMALIDKDGKRSLLLSVISLIITFSYFAFLMIEDHQERERMKPAECRSNLRELGIAENMYMCDHGYRFPHLESWNSDLKTYARNHKNFVCPCEKDQTLPTYAMNGQLKGPSGEVVDEHTVLFFESKSGKNLHGGPELLPETSRHFDKYSVVFLDGHADFYTKSEIYKLNWDPKKKPAKETANQ